MAKVPFKYSVQDSYNRYERAEYILGQLEDAGVFPEAGVGVDEFAEEIGNPFGDVKFDCTYDTETHEVEVIQITL